MGIEGGTRGWKLSGIDAVDYAQMLLDYERELAKDDYVIGATPFTSGAPPDWADFSIDEITYYLIETLAAQDELGGQTMPEFTLGFKDYAAAHPEVGAPVEGLQYDDDGNAWQHSTGGLMFWHRARNESHFFEKSPLP